MPRTKEQIDEKISELNKEVEILVDEANSHITEKIEGEFHFKYEISAPRDVLTEYERALSLCFVTKYEALPEPEVIDIREHKGKFYPNNIDFFRHLLNEYRPIIQNQNDSTHFSKVHSLCRQKLANDDPKNDLSITAIRESGEDITQSFVNLLNQKNRAINRILANCEFDYIYNGILQHSDHKYTKRYVDEYNSGELHYFFIKHASVCAYIKEELEWHYYLLRILSGVIMGPM